MRHFLLGVLMLVITEARPHKDAKAKVRQEKCRDRFFAPIQVLRPRTRPKEQAF